ncbi:hypothetical protein SEA_SONALI_53 [Arthrobacter phage Sonali]|uniref:Uncharacterized protein n=1 Tax=Arthrobacter phage Sonali TaxID=2510495 RepID=A0A411CQG4_9CAUD|nr:hypothetical protein HOV09_gp53 [Arthrobacter phage Sonali]QAY16165.1 hypothetical protein SEA_SONALI_53 [Arthrobacter phage Sonali]
MSIIARLRKARKDYVCASDYAHDRTIRKGDIYARVKASPGYEFNIHPGKWHEYPTHPECTEYVREDG